MIVFIFIVAWFFCGLISACLHLYSQVRLADGSANDEDKEDVLFDCVGLLLFGCLSLFFMLFFKLWYGLEVIFGHLYDRLDKL